MFPKNVLLLFGGGGTEHEISERSSKFIIEQLKSIEHFNTIIVEIDKEKVWRLDDGTPIDYSINGTISIGREVVPIDFAIPCVHGVPGENGALAALFELSNVPYLGCNQEASRLCFNKVSTKLWFQEIGIPSAPFVALGSMDDLPKAEGFFSESKDVFVKAASQGSSVGCYHATNIEELRNSVQKAFQYSDHVLIEKTIKGRELEIATYEYDGKIIATPPGEIICPGGFYTYEEKYDSESHTETRTNLDDLPKEVVERMRDYALHAYHKIGLKHLSRIDFFLTEQNEIYINEINTFPGLTSISMFPEMMKAYGHNFKHFLQTIIDRD